MRRRVVIIQGHPDASDSHFCHALAQAYAEGAQAGGIEVRTVNVAALDFPLLRTREEWEQGELPSSLVDAQQAIRWAEHLLIVYPLWLGSMPALLKAFFEQVLRPGFAVPKFVEGGTTRPLQGKTARIVVTMGMPAFFYRFFFGAHSVKSLERNILKFCGVNPVETSIVGNIETPDARKRDKWLETMRTLGAQCR